MISACMTVSVRELRTAVREWACCTEIPKRPKNNRGLFPVLILLALVV